MNGTTNGDSTIKANDVANNKDQASGKMKDEAGKPSSNLKCLEDPNFSFDDSTTTATTNPASSESKPSTEAGKKPSYRVLEDPEVNVAKPKTTGYKVGREVKKRNKCVFYRRCWRTRWWLPSTSQPSQILRKGGQRRSFEPINSFLMFFNILFSGCRWCSTTIWQVFQRKPKLDEVSMMFFSYH